MWVLEVPQPRGGVAVADAEEDAARPKHAMHLCQVGSDGGLGVVSAREGVEDTLVDGDVEAAVGERRLRRIHLEPLQLGPPLPVPVVHQPHGDRGSVDVDDAVVASIVHGLRQQAVATAEVEDLAAAIALGGLLDELLEDLVALEPLEGLGVGGVPLVPVRRAAAVARRGARAPAGGGRVRRGVHLVALRLPRRGRCRVCRRGTGGHPCAAGARRQGHSSP
mmetsp:Transcript_29870/g.84154  ORF Transcript_29870/g.84154 Transcript_29870/m.84154 type:complete len:221 (+) Transcript_29870:162-824(+)